MSDKHIDDVPPHDRRQFFARSFSRMLRPLASYIEKRLPIEALMRPAGVDVIFRPPGAIAPAEFLQRCFRCGSCADDCPADAIELISGMHEKIDGTPRLDPNRRACVVCEDLACMRVCPSGALQLVDRSAIRIGLARVNHTVCLRNRGEPCTVCIEQCPIGETAIRINEQGLVEITAPQTTPAPAPASAPTSNTGTPSDSEVGCIGCGVCVGHCPARPGPALRVHPV